MDLSVCHPLLPVPQASTSPTNWSKATTHKYLDQKLIAKLTCETMCAPDWEYIYAHEQNNFISPPPKTKDLLEERFYISTRVEQVFVHPKSCQHLSRIIIHQRHLEALMLLASADYLRRPCEGEMAVPEVFSWTRRQ